MKINIFGWKTYFQFRKIFKHDLIWATKFFKWLHVIFSEHVLKFLNQLYLPSHVVGLTKKIVRPRTPFNVDWKKPIFPQGNGNILMNAHRMSTITSLVRSPAFDRSRIYLNMCSCSLIHRLFKITRASTFWLLFVIVTQIQSQNIEWGTGATKNRFPPLKMD